MGHLCRLAPHTVSKARRTPIARCCRNYFVHAP